MREGSRERERNNDTNGGRGGPWKVESEEGRKKGGDTQGLPPPLSTVTRNNGEGKERSVMGGWGAAAT